MKAQVDALVGDSVPRNGGSRTCSSFAALGKWSLRAGGCHVNQIMNRSTHMLRALVVASVATTFALAAASTPLDAPLPVHGDSEAQGEAPAGDHAPDSENPQAGTPRTFTVYVQLPSSPAGVASPISFTQGSSVPTTVAQFVQAHAAELLAKGQQLSLESWRTGW
jgi:hypothetical protein